MSDGFAGAAQGGPPMKTDDLIKIEQYRRFLRPDWRRWLPPEPERGLTCEQIKAQRHDFMLRDRAFETPLARRLRKEQEAREREEQERLEAEHREEIEREALKLKAEVAALRFELVWAEFCRKYGYNPNQPRVPGGHGIESGRWTDSGSAAGDRARVAQYSIGTLIGQSRIRGGGSVCFYKFNFGIIMAPGPTNRSCPPWVPAAGVSHGKLIANDN
jgi:hypothetical protein